MRLARWAGSSSPARTRCLGSSPGRSRGRQDTGSARPGGETFPSRLQPRRCWIIWSAPGSPAGAWERWTTSSTDHSREQVPVLVYGRKVRAVPLGERATFADLGQTVAGFLGVGPLAAGVSFLGEVWSG